MARDRLPVPFGYGLDRASSVLTVDPRAGADLRDVFLLEGKVRVRAGMGASILTIASTDAIVHQEYFKSKAKIITVTYNRTTRDVKVYTGDVNGTSATAVATWGALAAGAVEPPRFSCAESFNIMLLAHDEPSVTKRLITKTYDGTTFASLTANLDNTSAKNVLFRGVVEHLGYIWGWGFGSDSDKSRPEMVRVSKPGDPTSFDQNHWFGVGERDDAILAARPCAQGLMVLKSSFRSIIPGTDKATFGNLPVDRTYGQVAMRLSLTLGTRVFAWTNEGPKVSDGGEFTGLEIPLELLDRLPNGLPEASLLANGHTAYFPDEKCIWWFFPDYVTGKTLVVTYSLRETLVGSRFAYLLLPKVIQSALVVAPSVESATVDPGYASSVSHSGVQVSSIFQTKITFTINAPVGDETVEIWGRQGASAGALITTFPINTSAGTQSAVLTLAASGSWDLWVRFVRAGTPRSDHPGSDPTAWPGASKATGTITALPALTPNTPTYTAAGTVAAGTWNASWNSPVTGAVVDVRVTSVESHTSAVIQNNAFVLTTAANATTMGAQSVSVAGGGAYDLFGMDVSVKLTQRLTVNTIAGSSPESAASTGKFLGLNEAPSNLTVVNVRLYVGDPPGTKADAAWQNSASMAGATSWVSELLLRWPSSQEQTYSRPSPFTTYPDAACPSLVSCATKGAGWPVDVIGWVRHKAIIAGVESYTRYSTPNSVLGGVCQL